MKVLILNSGMGSRMGNETRFHPKCMTDITEHETILSRQLRLLAAAGLKDIFITTGYMADVLESYCHSLDLPVNYHFIFNKDYSCTNYIYSIYCAGKYLLDDDLLLLHGDLVFEDSVLKDILDYEYSCMKISSTLPLPPKDFKAVMTGDTVSKIGVEFNGNDAVEAQAFYKLRQKEWMIWLDKICEFCETGKTQCYAETAFNEISEKCRIYGYDVNNRLCSEIDNLEDLEKIKRYLQHNQQLKTGESND